MIQKGLQTLPRSIHLILALCAAITLNSAAQTVPTFGHMDVKPGPVNIYYKPVVKTESGTNAAAEAIAAGEVIERCPGGAVANFGLHEVKWPDLSGTPIAIRTPEGKQLYFKPSLLVFRDTNDEVIALESGKVLGEIISDSTVIYPNLWPIAHATYEYTKRGLVQDVIIDKMPEFPKGFTPVRVEVWTAWTGAEPVSRSKSRVELRQGADGSEVDDDEFISFGHMRLVGGGTAFTMDNKAERVNVAKHWSTVVPGISWLIESVDFPSVEARLARLPKVKLHAAIVPRSVETLLASGSRNGHFARRSLGSGGTGRG